MRTGKIPDGGGDLLSYGTDVHNLLEDTTLWCSRKGTTRATGAKAIRLRHAAIRRQRESARLRREGD